MSDSVNVEDFVASLKVAELKEELKKRGLNVYGVKAVLAERLLSVMKGQEDNTAENEENQVEAVQEHEEEMEEGGQQHGEDDNEQVVTAPAPEAVEQVESAKEQTKNEQPVKEDEVENDSEQREEKDEESQPQVKEESGQEMENQPEVDTSNLPSTEETMETGDTKADVVVVDSTEVKQERAEVEQDQQEGAPRNNGQAERMEASEQKPVSGAKRGREDNDSNKEIDPRDAPDPEEPEALDEEEIKKMSRGNFILAQDDSRVTLDPYNSDLYFKIQPDGLGGHGLIEGGFAFLWAGAKASWGVKGGKAYYECKLTENLSVDLPESEQHPHVVRVGWSVAETDMTVGESKYSLGYGGTGKRVNEGRYENYGEAFEAGDVIGCYVDFTTSPVTFSFSKNGVNMGPIHISGDPHGKAFYPHISTKNVNVQFNFGEQEPWFPPEENKSTDKASQEVEAQDEAEKDAEATDKEEKVASPSKEAEESVQEESKMECDKSQAEGQDDNKNKEEQDAKKEGSEETQQEDDQKKVAEERKKEDSEKEDEEKETKPDGFVLLQHLSRQNKQRSIPTPERKSDCEVLMMVGLPAAGKTTWATRYARENADRRYQLLGTNLIMDRMKVSGLSRRQNYQGRWDSLIKLSTDILNKLFVIASESETPRNYILDQTNVYASAQRRKMGYFQGYKKKAVVVIPPHHELRRRKGERLRECGSEVPEEAIKAMKANFHIPRTGDPTFDDIIYTEIYGFAAEKIVQQYKDDAMGVPFNPPQKRGRYQRGRGYGSGPRQPYGYYGHYQSSSHHGGHYNYPPPPPPPPRYPAYPHPPPSWGASPSRGRYPPYRRGGGYGSSYGGSSPYGGGSSYGGTPYGGSSSYSGGSSYGRGGGGYYGGNYGGNRYY